MKNSWKPISRFRGADFQKVDLWVGVGASMGSYGMADEWRVTDAYRREGKWYIHDDGKEKALASEYITHYISIPPHP